MRLGLSRKAPSRHRFVSLASGLTWLAWEHAFETHELIEWLAANPAVPKEDVIQLLTQEWHALADAACVEPITVRAFRSSAHEEVTLSTHELRNFRELYLRTNPYPCLELNRFGSSFDEAFKARALDLSEALEDPVVRRVDLIRFKVAEKRAPRTGWNDVTFKLARNDIQRSLANEKPRTGLKGIYVEEVKVKFGVPHYVAEDAWTEAARAMKWPLRGRPKKSEKENSETPSGLLNIHGG